MTPILYHGNPDPRPVEHTLRAGNLTVTYQNGLLRSIRLGNREILRNIYFALRDENWATIPAHITDEQIDAGEGSFRVSFVCTHAREEAQIIRWNCELTGSESGEVRFSIDGTVLQAFQRNRAGLCVLHPIDGTIGQAVRIGHPDGSHTNSHFPKLISPHQPFFQVASMQWSHADGGEATLTFVGEVFETEDQRNWSDTSFKTYCTPQDQPKPVLLQPGNRIQHTATLTVLGEAPTQPTDSETPIQLISLPPSSPSSLLPKVGLTHAIDQPKLKTDEAAHLRKMGLEHLMIRLDFGRADWSEWLTVGLSEAKRIGAEVVLSIVFTDNYQTELYQLQMAVEWLNPVVAYVEVLMAEQSTPDALMAEVAPVLRQVFAGSQLGTGPLTQFTELNRNRPDPTPLDYLVYPMNPQVHAYDNQTLIENIAAQAHTVRTARSFAEGKAIHVGPVTLRPLPDPVADHRHPSLLAAGWLLGSLAALASEGATRVTYFDTKGPRGVMEGIDPETNRGQVYPTGLLLMALADWQGAVCVSTQTDAPLSVSSLHVQKDGRELLLLANHTWDEQTVALPDDWPLPTSLWSLDETNAQACMETGSLPEAALHTERQIVLKPFATVGVVV